MLAFNDTTQGVVDAFSLVAVTGQCLEMSHDGSIEIKVDVTLADFGLGGGLPFGAAYGFPGDAERSPVEVGLGDGGSFVRIRKIRYFGSRGLLHAAQPGAANYAWARHICFDQVVYRHRLRINSSREMFIRFATSPKIAASVPVFRGSCAGTVM